MGLKLSTQVVAAKGTAFAAWAPSQARALLLELFQRGPWYSITCLTHGKRLTSWLHRGCRSEAVR